MRVSKIRFFLPLRKSRILWVSLSGLSLYLFGEVKGRYEQREFMRLVRQKNELLKLENTTLKEFNDFPMQTGEGKETSLFGMQGAYLCVFYGDFPTFLSVRSAMLKTAYFDELRFVYFNSKDSLEKIVKNPLYKLGPVLANTTLAVPGQTQELQEGEVVLLNPTRDVLVRLPVPDADVLAKVQSLTARRIGEDKERVFLTRFAT